MFLYRNNRVNFLTIVPGPWTGSNEHMFDLDPRNKKRPRLTVEVVTTHIWVEPAFVISVENFFIEVIEVIKFFDECLFHSDGVFHYIEFTHQHCFSPFGSPLLWLYYSTDFLSCQDFFKKFFTRFLLPSTEGLRI